MKEVNVLQEQAKVLFEKLLKQLLGDSKHFVRTGFLEKQKAGFGGFRLKQSTECVK